MYDRTCPDSAVRPLCPRRSASGQDGIWATVLQPQNGCRPGCRWRISGEQMKGRWENRWAAAFIWLTFSLNAKPFTYPFHALIKKVGLRWDGSRSLKYITPPSSQITGHLNKVPMIQPSSLLTSSGSDRQHQWPPFQFQNQQTLLMTRHRHLRRDPGIGFPVSRLADSCFVLL